MRFQRVATIDAEFYTLGLPAAPERVYFYLSARCATRFHVSEAEMIRALHLNVHTIRAAVRMLVDMNMVRRWAFPRPKCSEYLVTLSTEQGWGIGLRRAYSMGSRRAPLRGLGEPYNGAQESPSPITNEYHPSSDTALLSLFRSHFTSWRFNRKPIGRHFVFTMAMQSKGIEMMRWLTGQPGMSAKTNVDAFLAGCGEYLSLPRDVLSPTKDQRALSPVRWLNEWHEQIRLAGIYLDEKAEKVTRIDNA